MEGLVHAAEPAGPRRREMAAGADSRLRFPRLKLIWAESSYQRVAECTAWVKGPLAVLDGGDRGASLLGREHCVAPGPQKGRYLMCAGRNTDRETNRTREATAVEVPKTFALDGGYGTAGMAIHTGSRCLPECTWSAASPVKKGRCWFGRCFLLCLERLASNLDLRPFYSALISTSTRR